MTIESDSDGDWRTDDAYYYRCGANESFASAVVRAVGAVSGRDPVAPDADGGRLEPLYETIDPDALDALFHDADDGGDPVGTVRFDYCGHEVTVDSTGLVSVTVSNPQG